MCLITAAPKGVSKKGYDLEAFIRSGMRTNTHGSGYAYKKNGSGKVTLSKGFMTSESIIEAITNEDLDEEDELIIHHRIGTSGSKESFNTHPFFISTREATVKIISGSKELGVMAHNGIISEFEDRDSIYNDTFLFVQNFIAIPQILKQLKDNTVVFQKRYASLISGEKLAFLFPDTDMKLLGRFIEDDGYFHSNTGYINYTFDRGGSSGRGQSCSVGNVRTQSGSENSFWQERYNRLNLAASAEPDDESFQEGDDEFVPIENMIFGDHTNRNTKSEIDTLQDSLHESGFPYAVGFESHNLTPKSDNNSTLLDGKSSLSENKKHLNGLKFDGSTIHVTSKNFPHFIFIPRKDIVTKNYGANGLIKANRVYMFADYDENSQLNYITEKYGDQEMFFIDLEQSINLFNVYVVHEFRDKYIDLSKFINTHLLFENGKSSLSASMSKKVQKTLSRVGKFTEFVKFKEHGWFLKNDLYFLYNKFGTVKQHSKHDYAAIADELIRKSVITSDDKKLSMSSEYNDFSDNSRFD